jgi:nucleotide-binding universal stress UspA family protein
MNIRSVLVPVDFSAHARPALGYACQLAARVDASVDVLHVVPPPHAARVAMNAYLGRPLPHASRLDVLLAYDRLHDFMGACERCGIVPVLRVEEGDVAATIVRIAAELPADLVVMATGRRRGVGELLRGSIANRVITCVGCPVVTLAHDRQAPFDSAQFLS